VKDLFKEEQMFTENSELLSMLEDARTTESKPKKVYVGKKKGKKGMKKKEIKKLYEELKRLEKKLEKKSKNLKKAKRKSKLQSKTDFWGDVASKTVPIIVSKSLDILASRGKS